MPARCWIARGSRDATAADRARDGFKDNAPDQFYHEVLVDADGDSLSPGQLLDLASNAIPAARWLAAYRRAPSVQETVAGTTVRDD